MNHLNEAEIAWIAGLYEGEGCCVSRGSAFQVEVVMTDHDVVTRLHALVGVGTLKGPYRRNGSDPTRHKPITLWRVASKEGVDFLEAIIPWLGERRRQRAEEAVHLWKTTGKKTRPSDNECIHGHKLTTENRDLNTRQGVCRTCKRAAYAKHRHKKRAERAFAAGLVM